MQNKLSQSIGLVETLKKKKNNKKYVNKYARDILVHHLVHVRRTYGLGQQITTAVRDLSVIIVNRIKRNNRKIF